MAFGKLPRDVRHHVRVENDVFARNQTRNHSTRLDQKNCKKTTKSPEKEEKNRGAKGPEGYWNYLKLKSTVVSLWLLNLN